MPIKKFVKKWSLRLPTYITDEQRPNVDSPLIQVITLQDSQQKHQLRNSNLYFRPCIALENIGVLN